MSKSRAQDTVWTVLFKACVGVFILEGMFTFLPNIMPVGFIPLVPVAVYAVYTEVRRFRQRRASRRTNLDEELRELLKSHRLGK